MALDAVGQTALFRSARGRTLALLPVDSLKVKLNPKSLGPKPASRLRSGEKDVSDADLAS